MSLGDAVQQREGVEGTQQGEEVLVQATVPCEDLALADTFERVPDATVSSGNVAGAGGGALPLLWIAAPDHDRLEAALEEDPSTRTVARLTTRGGACLYRISWAPTVEILVEILASEGATVVDASADHEGWRLRVLYPSHCALGNAMEYCERHNVRVGVQSIRQLTGDSSGQYGLTEPQYRSLKLACEQGYFEVPRETNLDEIARSQGISHQALSERLRRGTEKLVSQALFCDQNGGQNPL